MPRIPPLPDLPPSDENAVGETRSKPWLQQAIPGSGGGGGGIPASGGDESAPLPGQLAQELDEHLMGAVIDTQSALAHYPQVDRFRPAANDNNLNLSSNSEAWQRFRSEDLYDTRRVTLEHFHLFEWFPLAPGRYHTGAGAELRQLARDSLVRTPRGTAYYDPYGKANMIRGGVGAVRLRPRLVDGEAHYFMTASATGVCHEGFPVLVPRRLIGQVIGRIKDEGAAPVTLSGEMRYLYDDLPSFFGNYDLPQLYLYIDKISPLSQPRRTITTYSISAAISFIGEFEGKEGMYATFNSFDPANRQSIKKAITWLESFYVTQKYKGVVVTDFDEVHPRFPGAVFGLPDLMAGKLDKAKVRQFLKDAGLWEKAGEKFYLVYKEINTHGGAYIEGDVHTGGGDFIGRDQTSGGGN